MSILERSRVPQEDLFLLATILFGAAYVASPKRVVGPDGENMHYLAFGHQSARDLFASMGMASVEADSHTTQAHRIVELLAENAALRARIRAAKELLKPVEAAKAVASAVEALGPDKW